MASFVRTLATTLVLGVFATLIATWLIAGIALRPLRQLSDLVSSFTPQVIRDEVAVKPMPAVLAGFQQELASVRTKLRESIRSQDRLIANLSHELKTPIAILLTEAQILNTSATTPEIAEFVHSVRQEMRRLGSSISTFAQLAKLQGEHSLPAPATHPVNDLVINAVTDCSVLATRKSVTLRMEISEDIQTPVVLGNGKLLEAMYGHILQHCIRMSAKGDEVVVTVVAKGDRCLVTIVDRGPPIASAFLASIFEHFQESPAECSDRRELRLSIAKGIAELHAGSIQVSNTNATGCLFTIDLPRFVPAIKPPQ